MIKDVDKIIFSRIVKTASVWNHYLYSGFFKLGIDIKRSEICDQPPNVKGTLPFDIFWKSGECQRIWYDYCDFRRHYYGKTVTGNDLYFKIMLHKEDVHFDRIYPIGQTTAGTDEKMLSDIVSSQKKQESLFDVIGIFRQTDHGIRTKAVEIVKSQPWKSMVGIAHSRNRPPIPKSILCKKMGWKAHLELQCRSKICLDFPGVGGDWAWRFTEILGMGRFCLRTEPLYAYPGNPQNCWGEVKQGLSDLTEKINYYLSNDEIRNEIARNGKQYYEDYLSPRAQATYVLKIARKRL